MALLERGGLKVVPPVSPRNGNRHQRWQPYEVTTLRTDVETFGRRARVAHQQLAEDAARRDFTMNALSAVPTAGSGTILAA